MIPAAGFRRFTLPLAGGEIAGIAWGEEGPPDIIFLHANGFNALTYRAALAPLAERGLRVVALDQRGHGRSTLPADPAGRTGWDDLRDDLLAVLPRLGGWPILAGHSLGGTVSLLAAAKAQDALSRLVLVDPVILRARGAAPMPPLGLVEAAGKRRSLFPGRAGALEAYRGRGAFRTWPDLAIADYLDDGLRPAADGFALSCAPAWEASNFLVQGHDVWGALDAVRLPLEILKGEEGSTCMLDAAWSEIAAHPERGVTIVPGTTHFLPMEKPQALTEALWRAVKDPL